MSNDDSLERTYNDRLRERLEDMNTPTPRTDEFQKDADLRDYGTSTAYNFARQLEQELNEAKEQLILKTQFCDGLFLAETWKRMQSERDQLKRERDEARKESDCQTEIADAMTNYMGEDAALILERDQLRKVVEDALSLANRITSENLQDDILCSDGFTFSFQRNSKIHEAFLQQIKTINQLPHVKQKETK